MKLIRSIKSQPKKPKSIQSSKMFCQTILLASIIALATSTSSWFEVGTRVVGDRNISNRTDQTAETELPKNHTILLSLSLVGSENTFTYGRFDVYEV